MLGRSNGPLAAFLLEFSGHLFISLQVAVDDAGDVTVYSFVVPILAVVTQNLNLTGISSGCSHAKLSSQASC